MVGQAKQFSNVIPLPTPNKPVTIPIVRKIKDAVEHKMCYLFDGLMLNVVDALFDESYSTDQPVALRQQFNISRSLKMQDAPYRDHYSILMNLSWVNLIKCKNRSPLAEPDDAVMMILKNYAKGNQAQYKILLEELRQRFSALTENPELTYHPLLPINFYLCFWYATEKLNLQVAERLLLLPLFNRFVMDRFGQVLSIANQGLVEQNVHFHASS